MFPFAEGTSIVRPPLLNDSNYPYWKVRMRAFIKCQNEKAWRMVFSRWSPPIVVDSKGNSKLKYELEWSSEDDKLSAYNSKALHAIFNGVSEGCIKLISSCESAKDAWQILQTQFEGTSDVKRSRFIMLQTKFDDLRMSESKTLSEFYERLSDIANEYFALGEKLDESVLIRKIVRVLPNRFDTKLLAMEEAKDFSKMKVEELMGDLRTFELNQQIKQKDKPKSIADRGKGQRGFTGLGSNGTESSGKTKFVKSSVPTNLTAAANLRSVAAKMSSVEAKSPLSSKRIKSQVRNGCSRYMTSDKDFIVNIKPVQCGEVTFDNGLTGNVIGVGTLNFEGLPRLKNVMLIEGLKANLLSISQICDQGYTVNFDNDHCFVLNSNKQCILQGFRSVDNCYTLTSVLTCHSACENTSAAYISKNLVQRSRTKYIDIRHHFIREPVDNQTL
ncbi:uncharacterized protein LOC133038258 [Cannabis sativa]|uniref:uncharacterized protein LOC133038258 n=1 Tax=Cannabis sativa TaxID=3483 RepID=UPI0029CA5101|nr:uncharacterized protein LOC133038258 [Cannabis sativa]